MLRYVTKQELLNIYSSISNIVVLQSIQQPEGRNADQTLQVVDEIKQYLDCRYLAAHEGCWRLFEFSIHYREPPVQHLLIHLPGLHNVYFSDHDALTCVLARPDVHKTMFTEWMATNQQDQTARTLLYGDFPS